MGAGAADTYRVNDSDELENVLLRLGHVSEVSVEEFVEGNEYTFDTVCIDGDMNTFSVQPAEPAQLIFK